MVRRFRSVGLACLLGWGAAGCLAGDAPKQEGAGEDKVEFEVTDRMRDPQLELFQDAAGNQSLGRVDVSTLPARFEYLDQAQGKVQIQLPGGPVWVSQRKVRQVTKPDPPCTGVVTEITVSAKTTQRSSGKDCGKPAGK